MKRAGLAILLLPLLVACPEARQEAPVGEKVTSVVDRGWTVPPHVCMGNDAHTVPQPDGGVIQTCSSDGVLHGRFVSWYASGVKAQEGMYTDGQRTGKWVWWHPSGKLATKGTFWKDQEIGPWTWWHANGETEARGDHLDGRRAGLWTTWFATGQKKSEGHFFNGTKDGDWTFWLPTGEEDRTEKWEAGHQVAP